MSRQNHTLTAIVIEEQHLRQCVCTTLFCKTYTTREGIATKQELPELHMIRIVKSLRQTESTSSAIIECEALGTIAISQNAGIAGSETPHGQGPCPSGCHCPTYAPDVIKACGPGTFCPSVANAEPMHCLPGTSNSLYGQIKCMKCPKGTPKSSRICTRKPPSFCHHSAAC